MKSFRICCVISVVMPSVRRLVEEHNNYITLEGSPGRLERLNSQPREL